MANHLGFRSVAAWLTSLAENGVHDFDEAIYTMSRRRKELYAISEEEEGEKPLKVNVRRAYRVELDRLFQLALSVPELQASNQRVFMDKGELNRWLFEVMNTVTLVAERRGASWASCTRRWRRPRPASCSSLSFRNTGDGGSVWPCIRS